MENASKSNDELDALLDSALDDFDNCTDLNEMEVVAEEGRRLLENAKHDQSKSLHENMSKFLEDAQNPEFQNVLEKAFRELSGDDHANENVESLLSTLSKDKTGVENRSDVDIGVAKALQGIAEAAEDLEGCEASKAETMGEDMMADMMKEFEKLGDKQDFDGIVDGMMEQLLSKDVMYEPMKQICEKYPEWLAEKENLLSPEEYQKFGKQYQYFQEIVGVYETEPDNHERLQYLMQQMQECGQPPAEIVKELAPGLEFDDQGMPIMPNMGPSMMPNGMKPGQEQCVLM